MITVGADEWGERKGEAERLEAGRLVGDRRKDIAKVAGVDILPFR
jgi:hypothetical protein